MALLSLVGAPGDRKNEAEEEMNQMELEAISRVLTLLCYFVYQIIFKTNVRGSLYILVFGNRVN